MECKIYSASGNMQNQHTTWNSELRYPLQREDDKKGHSRCWSKWYEATRRNSNSTQNSNTIYRDDFDTWKFGSRNQSQFIEGAQIFYIPVVIVNLYNVAATYKIPHLGTIKYFWDHTRSVADQKCTSKGANEYLVGRTEWSRYWHPENLNITNDTDNRKKTNDNRKGGNDNRKGTNDSRKGINDNSDFWWNYKQDDLFANGKRFLIISVYGPSFPSPRPV